MTEDEVLRDSDSVEVRGVISGGAPKTTCAVKNVPIPRRLTSLAITSPSVRPASPNSFIPRWHGASKVNECSPRPTEFWWPYLAERTAWPSGRFLLQLGYNADALYLDLGIGEYSVQSRKKVERFHGMVNPTPGAKLHIHTLAENEGAGVKELATMMHRPTCSTCGAMKRYHFNRTALEKEYDVMATGHNLDDEAARLLGNVLHWQTEFLDKQTPTLPASMEGFAKKVKPLYRLTEREMAAYAIINKIPYMVDECPMAKGSKMLIYKEVLNRLETESPGTKQTFYWKFLDKQAKEASKTALTISDQDQQRLHPCQTCGQPTSTEVCTYCKMMARAKTPA